MKPNLAQVEGKEKRNWKVSKHGHIWYQPAVRAMLEMYEKGKKKILYKYKCMCINEAAIFYTKGSFLGNDSGSSALAYGTEL